MKKVYPFLMFTNCKTEEALNLYSSIFDDATVHDVIRWPDNVPGGPFGKVQSAKLTLKDITFRFMDSDGHDHALTASTSIFIVCDSEDELKRAYKGLVDGGRVLMPLDQYPFAKLFVWVEDRYGLNWQLSL